jgi:hypothetical protein
VRGVNARGPGEWSAWASLWTAAEVERQLKELEAIPTSWVLIILHNLT